jgi:hypothetical protein
MTRQREPACQLPVGTSPRRRVKRCLLVLSGELPHCPDREGASIARELFTRSGAGRTYTGAKGVRNAIFAAGTERPTRKVEVFGSGCCCSGKLVTAIRAVACPSCEVRVLDVKTADGAERANQLGVQSVPAVAINDELVCCPCECGPDLARLRAAGLGVPLSEP